MWQLSTSCINLFLFLTALKLFERMVMQLFPSQTCHLAEVLDRLASHQLPYIRPPHCTPLEFNFHGCSYHSIFQGIASTFRTQKHRCETMWAFDKYGIRYEHGCLSHRGQLQRQRSIRQTAT